MEKELNKKAQKEETQKSLNQQYNDEEKEEGFILNKNPYPSINADQAGSKKGADSDSSRESDDDNDEGEEEKQDVNGANSDETSSESDFEWIEENDEELYFAVCTRNDLSPGEQIFNHYGRRTNRFLVMWYGFTYMNNKYDSYPFRMWMNYKPHKLDDKIFESIVY